MTRKSSPGNGGRNGSGGRGGRGSWGRSGGRSSRGGRSGRGGRWKQNDERYSNQQVSGDRAFDRQKIEVEDFLKILLSTRGDTHARMETMQRMISQFPAKWIAAWEFGPSLPTKQLEFLLTVLARIPFSSSVGPPPMYTLQESVHNFLQRAQEEFINNMEEKNVQHVQLMLNVVARLLKFEWKAERLQVKEMLESMLCAGMPVLNLRLPEHRQVQIKINTAIGELDKPWVIHTCDDRENSITEVEDKTHHLANWKQATVGWLSTPSLFVATSLPVMKVPGSDSDGIYDSMEDYFETMIGLWIGLTFGDGYDALSPSCAISNNDKYCGRALAPIDGQNIPCRNKNCYQNASYTCSNRHHAVGLCHDCMIEAQRLLRSGSPGQASTHIYDGSIKNIHFDGTLQLIAVEARRKPLHEIHWKGTKRLSCPNLVGIVKLANRKAPLHLQDRIMWGEIIRHRQSSNSNKWREEWEFRQEGRIAISIVGTQDAHSFLKSGDAVAVIDCYTFCPEYIPVLEALESQRSGNIPFSNGAMLNMSMETVVYPNSVRLPSSNNDCFVNASVSEIQSKVTELVDTSLLEPIIQLRREESTKRLLIQQLGKLVVEATLDVGQFHAFMTSLQLPVHCTHGPPGSGKSYTAVIIVRALLIIRKLWIAACPSVGSPPILVLSYKNHAIDEFLVDLITMETHYLQLIRLGGKSDHPMLGRYSERNVVNSNANVLDCQHLAERIHSQIANLANFQDDHNNIVLSEEMIVDNEMDLKALREKSKIDYTAATSFQRMLVRIYFLLQESSAIQGKEGLDISEMFSNFKTGLEESNGDMKESLSQLFKLKSALPSEQLKTLFEELGNKKIDVAEVLWMWMQGKMLCKYMVEKGQRCTMMAQSDAVFLCSMHQCPVMYADLRCTNEVDCEEGYCLEHTCAEPYCGSIRLPGDQVYCNQHACIKCLEQNETAKLAVDEFPRNTCAMHPLCLAIGRLGPCDSLAVPNEQYCARHKNNSCVGLTKEGYPCESQIITSRDVPYCKMHRSQIPREMSHNVVETFTASKCKAKTKKNRNCKGTVLPGMEYCRDHLSLYDQPSTQNLPAHAATSVGHSPVSNNVENSRNLAMSTEHSLPFAQLVQDSSIENTLANEEEVANSINFHVDEASSIFESIGRSMLDESSLRESTTIIDNGELDEEDFEEITEGVEESYNAQHLRDIYDLDEECDDTFFDLLETTDHEEPATSPVDYEWTDPMTWSWDMPLEKRRAICREMLLLDRELLKWVEKCLRRLANETRTAYQFAKVQANSTSFEGKEIIGGTIVGCIKRLDAIRAMNPFAIVIEEASEVMEPLVFACLGATTCKLEMIGDHLQLQPAAMNKYEFELHNNIKISMFERLVCGPSTHAVPYDVLSVQRRMRKNICDLTRAFYTDVTTIIDHPVCSTKLIADGALMDCATKGREVPGISPNIFFWTHDGRQERARVGLSRINSVEANMVVQLVEYLVRCSVPKSSIAILTPYKGQLMLLRDMLIKKRLLIPPPKRQYGQPPIRSRLNTTSVIVSTVDRFQGDEADIVIASLVIDVNSTTPFVKLVNRMIVLLSRARLGLYIVGNVEYFKQSKNGVQHWIDTIEKLEHSAPSDTDLVKVAYDKARIGPQLPLCCAIHRESSTRMVQAKDSLSRRFCRVLCTARLPCLHLCNEYCHFSRQKHRSPCLEVVDSPCDRHPRKLECHQIMANIRSAPIPIEEALQLFQCDQKVEVVQECQHIIKVNCAQECELAAGRIAWPKCVQQAHSPYIYPDCMHSLSCLCWQKKSYLENAKLAPFCQQKAQWVADCGHSITVNCYLKQKYVATNGTGFVCPIIEKIVLPRCGHEANVPCQQAVKLKHWEGESCRTGRVINHIAYGPKDFPCNTPVTFIRQCGHEETLPCEKAFDYAIFGAPTCVVQERCQSPLCGHINLFTCSDKNKLKNTTRSHSPVKSLQEKDICKLFVKVGFSLSFQCKEVITLLRSCGHKSELPCYQVAEFSVAPSLCKKVIEIQSPLCGHMLKLPCSAKNDWHPWDNKFILSQEYEDLVNRHVLLEATTQKITQFDPPRKIQVKKCTFVSTVKKKNCGHEIELMCHKAMDWVFRHGNGPDCSQIVEAPLVDCGHSREWVCDLYQKYLVSPNSASPCTFPMEIPCWNFSKCNAQVASECGKKSLKLPTCSTRSMWKCGANIHTYEYEFCRKGSPSACPGCSQDEVQLKIQGIESVVEAHSTGSSENDRAIQELCDMNDYLQALLPQNECAKALKIGNLNETYLQYLKAKLTILINLTEWFKNQSLWDRPKFQCSVIPVFQQIKSGNLNRIQFDAKRNRFQGVEVEEWCLESIKKLSIKKGKKAKLLFGVGFTANVLMNPKPPGKKRKGFQSWFVRHKNRECFDAISHGTAFTFWDPAALFATHYVEFSAEELSILLECWPNNITRANVKPQLIYLQVPSSTDSNQHHFEVSDTADLHEMVFDHLMNSSLEIQNGYLRKEWNGQDLNVHVFGKQVESELKQKLTFIKMGKAKLKMDQPFGGIKRLKSLLITKPLWADLHLLLSLEFLSLGKQYLDDAKLSMNRYLHDLRDADAHPLLLIAAARVLRLDGDMEDSKQALQLFQKLFPDTAQDWLTVEELAIVLPQSNISIVSTSSANDPRQIWDDLKSSIQARSDAMESLLNLTGLRKIKLSVLQYFKTAMAFKKMDSKTQKKNALALNFLFTGNPGTGKTTVARIFGEVLFDSGIRSRKAFVETSAQALKEGGVKTLRDLATKASGGVLFIDEAYELDPAGDAEGRNVVSELLTLSENQRSTLTIILAGYADDMQTKLLSYNDGLPSRFDEICFDDYDEQGLLEIWNGMCDDRDIDCTPIIGHVICKRLAGRANQKGFGNARDVRKSIESAVQKACSRNDFEGTIKLQMQDVMGEHPRDNAKLNAVLDRLNSSIGWSTVKAEIAELVDLATKNYERELKGQHPSPICLNRLFLGNPGTGKTTCAKMYGEILMRLGLLGSGEVMMKSASEFIGQYIGQSATKTNNILNLAKGKVLVIDEAYSLDDKHFGKQVLDVLVEKIQTNDNKAVLLVGYEQPMLDMLRNQNPGLARRFPKTIMFEDYTDSELLEIFNAECESQNLVPESYEFAEKLIKILSQKRSGANFGNAGTLKSIIQLAVGRATCRDVMPDGGIRLLVDDIDSGVDPAKDPFEPLNKLFNIDNIVSSIRDLHDALKVAQSEGDATPEVGHFIFRGSPGTGKTTVARAIADILFQLELLATNNIVETSALALTGEYLGQTKKRVEEKLGQALGGVLFVDEAYELGKGAFGEEAMTVILEAMTSERYKGMVIIMAGYPNEMNNMLDKNPGLKSRFTEYLDFFDWTPLQCTTHLSTLASRENFTLDSEIASRIVFEIEVLQSLPGWANGRDVKQLWVSSKKYRATRVCKTPDSGDRIIALEDMLNAVHAMQAGREVPSLPSADLTQISADAPPSPPNASFSTAVDKAIDHAFNIPSSSNRNVCTSEEATSDSDAEVDEDTSVPRDPSVSDHIWQELKQAKKAEKRRLQNLKDEALKLALKEKAAIQERLRRIGKCCQGYEWKKVSSGWRCAGGSHFVSEAQMNSP